ncbi:MAG: hypothetical protein PHF05_06075, partial [Candidatus Izemoplasmatales bacterium]|nr:hypothetical protein [Candidatus Izemoplasmatales bacterium]
MKKTNIELLEFFGLKVGDKVRVEDDKSVYNIFKEDEVCEENDKYKHINCWNTTFFGSYLISRNYEVITPKKKLGEIKCRDVICITCPFHLICRGHEPNKTLNEIFETH